MLAFAGPAYLVSVGYMDPGNWATDLEGGARFGYQLLWVLVVSNLMAILLQTLAARLGIVAGAIWRRLAANPIRGRVCNALWVLCEIAIAACDLAEVLGAAIALKLAVWDAAAGGRAGHGARTLLVLWLSRYGIRLIEAVILELDRHHRRLLPGGDLVWPAGMARNRGGDSAAAEQRKSVRGDRHPGSDGDAA